jgi:hypothetical protein
MAKSISVTPKKRGRPATGRDPLVTARLPKEMIVAVEAWAAKNITSRSDAIRQLLEVGLASSGRKIPLIVASGDARSQTPRRKKSAARAAELAGEQIDKMGDVATTSDERQTRKRRLIKGPKELRDIRADQPGAKKR